MVKRIAMLVLCACLLPAAHAQESSTASQDEIVERILELQRQIEALMATLPSHLRADLRTRLAAADAQEPPSPPTHEAQEIAEASVEPATETSVEPATEPVTEAIVKPATEPTKITSAPQAPSPAPVIAASPNAIETPAPTPPSDGIPKLIKRRSRRAPCNTLSRFDENGDGKISSADRFWRYVYLWTDKNGDRQIQDREVESAYDHKVREIAVSLETFVRTKGSLGEVRVEEQIVLDLRGDGFSERSRRDDGVLVVDADALGRGNGPHLLGPGGEPLSGFQSFRSGLRLEAAGETTALNCP